MKKLIAVLAILLSGVLFTFAQTPLITSSSLPLGSAPGVAPGTTVMNFGLVTVTNLLTRPNDTTPYTAGDAVAAATTTNNFPAVLTGLVPNGSGKIIKVRLIASSTAAAGTYRIWFYNTASVNAQADNVAYSLNNAWFTQRVGYMDVTLVAGTDCALGMNIQDQLPVVSSDGNLYYRIQTLSGITPTANMTIGIEVTLMPYR